MIAWVQTAPLAILSQQERRTLCRLRFALVTAVFLLVFNTRAHADAFFPSYVGSTWEYEQSGAEPSRFTVRIASEETLDGKDLLLLETKADERLIQAQFISVDERGVLLHGRRSNAGEVAAFAPARVLLPVPLKIGTKWDLEDDVAGTAMHQAFKVEAQENVTVPAGEFRAYRLHCEQPWPLSISIERWFAPGTGFVKEITTTRGPNGRLLSRVLTVLTKFTPGAPPPEPPPSAMISLATPTPTPKPALTVQVAAERDGSPVTDFSADAEHIYVHWHGENLKPYSIVRVAWVVEDVGDIAEPGFVIDENENEVTGREFGARFVLSRPRDGWAPGKYRVEIYLDDILKEKVSVTIADATVPAASPSPR